MIFDLLLWQPNAYLYSEALSCNPYPYIYLWRIVAKLKTPLNKTQQSKFSHNSSIQLFGIVPATVQVLIIGLVGAVLSCRWLL